jgi:hypothetical protein
MRVRRGFIQSKPLKDRLAEFAANARKIADELPPGPRRDEALKRARQADTAAHIDAWVNSSGLQTPK